MRENQDKTTLGSKLMIWALQWLFCGISLLSRICGSMEALEVGLAYDTARFPWLDRCGTHKIFLLPLGFCCSGLRPRRRRSHLSHETSSSVALHGRVAC